MFTYRGPRMGECEMSQDNAGQNTGMNDRPGFQVNDRHVGVSDATKLVDIPPTPLWVGCKLSSKMYRFASIFLALLTILILAGCYFGIGFEGGSWKKIAWIAVSSVLVLFWICWGLYVSFQHFFTEYKLDTDRLLLKKGLIRQTTDALLVAQINDVKMEQTLWDRLINGGVGTVIIHSTDKTHPVLKLSGVDKPSDAFESISYLWKDYVRRRGIKSFGTGDPGIDGGDDNASYLS